MDSTRKLIEQIAKRHFGVETIETRNSDSLDFYDVSIGAIEAALREAYQRGREVALPNRRRTVADGCEWLMAFPSAEADGGIDAIVCQPSEVEGVIARRSPCHDEKFLCTLDVKRLVLGVGLRAHELDFGGEQ